MIKLFCGYDPREAVGFHVFVASVLERASKPVAIHALDSRGLPRGSNAFTYSRFLVPWLCGFNGHAIYADASDMLMLGDAAELDALFDDAYSVQVVQHESYRTKHPQKYVGTSMQCPNRDYPRKNWSSLMIMNCEHAAWAHWTPGFVESVRGVEVLQLNSQVVGQVPDAWNRLVDEGQPVDGAKLVHWTAGIPAFPHYKDAPGAALWHAACEQMLEVA
jgi:hypothetical protein